MRILEMSEVQQVSGGVVDVNTAAEMAAAGGAFGGAVSAIQSGMSIEAAAAAAGICGTLAVGYLAIFMAGYAAGTITYQYALDWGMSRGWW